MKRYVITTGSYSDYSIVTHVEGPDEPALEVLFKQFAEEFGIPARGNYTLNENLLKPSYYGDLTAALVRLKAAFGLDSSFACFIKWLTDNYEFTEIDVEEFNIGD